MKQKGRLTALLAAVLCLSVFVWFYCTGTVLLDNSVDVDPGSAEGIDIQDAGVPRASSPDSEDPFAQFTQEQHTAMNEVLELVNEARGEAGLPALELDPRLCQAAQVRAGECAISFSHTRPNGAKYLTAMTEVGLNPGYSGENVAAGHTSPEQVVHSWLMSQGHRANIMSEHYTKLGVGLVPNTGARYGGLTWVQLFMSEAA